MKASPYRNGFNRETWLTPKPIIDALGGADSFDLDPCAAPSPRPGPTAKNHFELPVDGFAQPWYGRVWLNPPYGAQASRWVQKLAVHGDGIALLFARTDTAFFHDYVFAVASAVLFMRRRVHFCDAGGKSAAAGLAPSVLIAYGQGCAESLSRSGIEGEVVRIAGRRLSADIAPLFAQVGT